ncbi:MAG: hypothetical protein U9O56_06690 [Campylobacterota bacterium]|nr:hypothetical protein [Campylobacterota bacterium]
MERRDRSLNALNELKYLDSLDLEDKANSLAIWVKKYLDTNQFLDFDLKRKELLLLSELFYKNLTFIKDYQKELRVSIDSYHKIRKFVNN